MDTMVDLILSKAKVRRALSNRFQSNASYIPTSDVRTPSPEGEFADYHVIVMVQSSVQREYVQEYCSFLEKQLNIKIKVLLI